MTRRHPRPSILVRGAIRSYNARKVRFSATHTEDSRWRNRDEFFEGREEIVAFLKRKWARELDYRLEKNLWCFTGNRIAVRFEYESRDAERQWWRSHPYHRPATKLSIVAATGHEPEVTLAVA